MAINHGQQRRKTTVHRDESNLMGIWCELSSLSIHIHISHTHTHLLEFDHTVGWQSLAVVALVSVAD